MAGLSEDQVSAILRAGMSPRAVKVSTYQRYYDGTIYEGRPAFLDMASDAPLTERAPCVIYPGVRNAVQSFSAMCLGEGRFPTITSLTNEDDSTFDPRFGLDAKQSEIVDAGIQKISDQSRLPAMAQQLLETALSAGTAVPIVSVVKGKLKLSQLDPKTCTPEFDDDGETVKALEVSYRYVDRNVEDPITGGWMTKVYQYRRRIDDTSDTVFKRVEVNSADEFPKPRAVQTKFDHHFGFCPVVWYRFLSTLSDNADVDGRPIHWGLLSLCDSINFGLSQRFRAALYCGDPQMTEFGVDEENSVKAPQGRLAAATQPGSDPSGWGMGLTQKRKGGRGIRKKGPGTIWTYESPDARCELLTLPADALKALEEDIKDNIKKLRESLGHVHIDPETLTGSGDISGKTLAFVFGTQIAICNKMREDFGAKCLLPVLNMLFRVVLGSSGANGLYLPGVKKLVPILQKFSAPVGAANDGTGTAPALQRLEWFEPTLKLDWGDYFEASDLDEQVRAAVAGTALEKGLITKKTAVNHIKPIFGDIKNVDQYIETLVKEAIEKAQTAIDNAVASAKAMAAVQAPTPTKGGGADGKPDPSATPPGPPKTKRKVGLEKNKKAA